MASQSNPASESLERQLLNLISERVLETKSDFDADSDLYESGLDSMAIIQLMLLVETEYRVAITETDWTRQNFSTTRQLAELIRERSARAA
ncbi:MAG: phosphopantetheine-binding protein [Verrucomicrobiota bacterium]